MFSVSPALFAELNKKSSDALFEQRYVALKQQTNEQFLATVEELQAGRVVPCIDIEVPLHDIDEDYAKRLAERLVAELTAEGYRTPRTHYHPATEDRPGYSSVARVFARVMLA